MFVGFMTKIWKGLHFQPGDPSIGKEITKKAEGKNSPTPGIYTNLRNWMFSQSRSQGTGRHQMTLNCITSMFLLRMTSIKEQGV